MKNLKCDLGEEELRREPYVPESQLTVAVPTAMPVLSFPVLQGNIKSSQYICPWAGEAAVCFRRLIKKSVLSEASQGSLF